ncbi:cubilin [Trichonephila clavata]|uniref:Cubilin n=1 Tax=Trichonephila clavata TaxID=2740835 RepID=A0A8X6G144_TRICU|nr:cubilin [Trichonephila clavata]
MQIQNVVATHRIRILSPESGFSCPVSIQNEMRLEGGKAIGDVCGLELTFQTFDLEPSDNCTYDYLQVDQNRLCGKINDGSVRMYDLNTLVI